MATKQSLYKSGENVSARIFSNELLNKLTKTPWWIPVVLFLPMILFYSYTALFLQTASVFQFFKFFTIGILFWTVIEYVFHRWVFHFKPQSDFQEYIHFMIHGVHHDYPNDDKRLVMSPLMSIPLAFAFYYIFLLFFEGFAHTAFFAGFVLGYLLYDLLHFALHHASFGKHSKLWQMLKKNHMDHHFVDPENGFGVSNVIWDKLFRTTIKKATSKK